MKRPRRRRIEQKPRKRKTFAELSELKDDEYSLNDDGIVFKFEDKDALPPITYAELLDKFYKKNYRLSPIAMKMDNNFQGPLMNKAWWIVMYANFFIDVEKGNLTAGPHRCRVWFRTFSKPVDNHWLATAQLEVFFFNEEQVRKAVKETIASKGFYMAPANAEIIVNP